MRHRSLRNPGTAEIRSAVTRYLVYGAVALVVVTVPTIFAMERIAEQHALESAALDGASIARRLLAPAVTDELLAGESEAIAAMDRRLVPRMSDGSLARVKIWTPDGTIIYSDIHELIGQSFPGEEDLVHLRTAGAPISAISALDDPENLYEKDEKGLVEVYAKWSSSAGTDVVYEVYFPLSRVERERDQLVGRMTPVGVLALGMLALSQLPLAVGLAKRVSSIKSSRTRLLAQAVRAVEHERKRLAQDLHDDVIQDLSGVAVTLDAMASSGAHGGDSAELTAQLVRRDIRMLRDIVANLFPHAPLEGGLDAAIRELAEGLRQHGLTVDVRLDPAVGLDTVTAGLLYRVAREALVNVQKHSGATAVEVDLNTTLDSVRLRVADNGRGTGTPKQMRDPGHVGLDIVGETIAEAGGTVVIEPRLPHGTVVLARLPR
jgi:signal transduction histidine kinase